MSRHRFIRNQNYEDDLDDEYDDFGSFSPNSPSAENYMYNNRHRDQSNDLSNFIVTKPANKKGPNTKEDEYEDDFDLVDKVMNEVYETLGDDGVNMSDDDLADLIRECNYKTDLTIDKILARNGAQPDAGVFSFDDDKPQQKKNAPQPGSSKQAAPASAKKSTNTAVDSRTGGRVTLAPQKYSPSTLAQQLSSASVNADLDRSNNAVKSILKDQNFSLNITSQIAKLPSDVKPFDFSGPSPDDEVMNKQNKAFTKKKVESVLTTVSEPLIVSTEPKVQPVVKKNLTPAQAKAAAAKKPTDKANIEQVTKDLDRMNIDDEMRKSSEIKKTPRKAVKQMSEARKKEVFNKIKEQPKGKDHLNMIVIGHVDAGKSTLMGHMLFLKGYVSQKTLAKYERDSRQIGKASFHYAWVLDEHEEERTRGITIDVAVNSFETDTKRITLLDAPGHRDFIPNMISGAAQADVGILVIRAGEGEFETAFSEDGQTKEHAILARSLGVTQLIVAVNQMDTVQWSQDRYELIKREVLAFLKKVGFKDTQLSFVPCSGLSGENLIERKEPKLSAWYDGPTLYNRIDNFAPAVRDMERPFRLSISDVYKDSNQSGGVTIAGKIEAGVVSTGDKLLLMPANEVCTVKHVRMAQGEVVDFATAGENVDIALTGIDIKVINFGNILCDPENPINLVRTITAQIITFSMPHPLVRGQSLYMFLHNLNEPVVMKKLVSVLDSTTGEVKQKRPRCLMDKSTAIVEIQTEKLLLLETYSNYKQLGRFTLREGNQTVAAGIITDLAWTSDAPAKPASNTNTEASK